MNKQMYAGVKVGKTYIMAMRKNRPGWAPNQTFAFKDAAEFRNLVDDRENFSHVLALARLREKRIPGKLRKKRVMPFRECDECHHRRQDVRFRPWGCRDDGTEIQKQACKPCHQFFKYGQLIGSRGI